MPTTEAEMQTAWEACNTEAGSPFSNSSEFSPFWRLISAIATKPSQWLLTLLENLQRHYGEERYRPCSLLRQRALLESSYES